MSATSSPTADALELTASQVEALTEQISEGRPIPYIAKYGHDQRGGIANYKLRQLQQEHTRRVELEARKETILQSLSQHEKLDDAIRQAILSANDKDKLQDSYYTLRPSRQDLASIAKAAQLEQALVCLTKPHANEEAFFAELPDSVSQLENSRKKQLILALFAEQCWQSADLIQACRRTIEKQATLALSTNKGKESQLKSYKDLPIEGKRLVELSPQEMLTLYRAKHDGAIRFKILCPLAEELRIRLQKTLAIEQADWFDSWLVALFEEHLLGKISIDVAVKLKERAENKCLITYTKQLRQMLLQAPAGKRVTLSLVNGFKAGVGVVVVDENGNYLDSSTIFPLAAGSGKHDSIVELAKLMTKHHVACVAIAKRNGAKELLALINELCETYQDLQLIKMLVSDAGSQAFAQLTDATLPESDLSSLEREGLTIARRLQDPVRELTQIPVTELMMGQHQALINRKKVASAFTAVFEDCINQMTVNINDTNAAMLSYVSGFSEQDALKVVTAEQETTISSWEQLTSLGLSAKALAYSGGFISIAASDSPVEKLAIHPDMFPIIEAMAKSQTLSLTDFVASREAIQQINSADFVTDQFSNAVITDTLRYLEKPKRYDRPVLKAVKFHPGLKQLADLKVGMVLEGIVGNVTTFGAFVNIGIKQDGLIHISEIPGAIKGKPLTKLVKTGDIVKVKVSEVDLTKERLNLSMKLGKPKSSSLKAKAKVPSKRPKEKDKVPSNSAMADALAKLNLTK